MKVILGYRHWPDVECPHCHEGHGAIENDGGEKYLYRCWCGATARIPKDDPDLVKVIEASA